ncbi:hypothetical protein C8Q77DRAFT_1118334 [Trametes polyzona]|nr:hypothetical protein C8Q77DRAFT_1118334 [Trametes polyzona]
MTTGHAEVVSTVVSLYSSQTIAVDLGIASTAMVLYDTILSLHREVQYVWRERRKWHQRVLYVLTRHMFTILLLLEEQTINPISDQNCQILVWSSSLAGFSSILGPTIFTIWRAYALSGKNKVVGGAMSLAGIVMIFYNAIVFLVITPINLPPPENCTSSSRLDASYNTPCLCRS